MIFYELDALHLILVRYELHFGIISSIFSYFSVKFGGYPQVPPSIAGVVALR